MNYSPPGSSVHRISQARILEWVAISFSRGSSWPRNQTHVSFTAGRFFTTEPPHKPLIGILICPQISHLYYVFLQFFSYSSKKHPLPTSWLSLKSKRNFGFFPFLVPYFQSIAKSCQFYLKNIASVRPLLSISVTPYSKCHQLFLGSCHSPIWPPSFRCFHV